jgi:hypothetical protein
MSCIISGSSVAYSDFENVDLLRVLSNECKRNSKRVVLRSSEHSIKVLYNGIYY